MTAYILKLLVMLPLVAGMAWGALWLWRKAQPGIAVAQGTTRPVRLVDAIPVGVSGKLAVVEFGSQRLLLAVTRNGVTCLARDGGEAGDA